MVVRRTDRAPLHRWDGTLIKNSTTRDEHKTNALIDSSVEQGQDYYYGIFPYDTKGDYRFTKTVLAKCYQNNYVEIMAVATNGSLGIVKISVPELNQGITLKYKTESGSTWTSVSITNDMLFESSGGNPLFYMLVIDDLTSNTDYEFKVENGNYTSPVTSVTTSVKTSIFNYNYQKSKAVDHVQGGTIGYNDSEQSFTLHTDGSWDCYTGTYQDIDMDSDNFIYLTPGSLSYTKLVFYSVGHLLQGSGNNKVRNMLFIGESGAEKYSVQADGAREFGSNTTVYAPVILPIEGYTANDIFTMRYGLLADTETEVIVKYDNIMIWFE